MARKVQTCVSSIEFVNLRAAVDNNNNNARKLACPKASSARTRHHRVHRLHANANGPFPMLNEFYNFVRELALVRVVRFCSNTTDGTKIV